MKKMRNLFILFGNSQKVDSVLKELTFKGVTWLKYATSPMNILKIFENNKSIICNSSIPSMSTYHEHPIYIRVTDSPSPYETSDYIDTSLGNVSTQFENIAKKYNCDIGDHKSNSSGLTGKPSISDCSYCMHLNGTFTKYVQKNLYESENFFVMATIGQFIRGYLLIIPKEHIMSMAEATPEVTKEFSRVIDDISYILNLTYNTSNILIWENGTGNFGVGKAKDSVVHAHTHIAPSNLNALKIAQISKIHFTKIGMKTLSHYGTNSYLLIRGNNNDTWFINDNPNIYIPRQYIRQILAEEAHIDGEAWNWRTHPFIELMNETNDDIISTLKLNWDSLPDRIKQNTKKFI